MNGVRAQILATLTESGQMAWAQLGPINRNLVENGSLDALVTQLIQEIRTAGVTSLSAWEIGIGHHSYPGCRPLFVVLSEVIRETLRRGEQSATACRTCDVKEEQKCVRCFRVVCRDCRTECDCGKWICPPCVAANGDQCAACAAKVRKLAAEIAAITGGANEHRTSR